jgi:hypothetical protein
VTAKQPLGPESILVRMTVRVIGLRRIVIALALMGILAKIALFEWINHTSDWTTGTRSLAYLTVLLGLVTMVLSVRDFVRSHGDWVPVATVILGLLTFVPVLGYAA